MWKNKKENTKNKNENLKKNQKPQSNFDLDEIFNSDPIMGRNIDESENRWNVQPEDQPKSKPFADDFNDLITNSTKKQPIKYPMRKSFRSATKSNQIQSPADDLVQIPQQNRNNENKLLSNKTEGVVDKPVKSKINFNYADERINVNKEMNASIVKNINNLFLISEYSLCQNECKRFLDLNTDTFSVLLNLQPTNDYIRFVSNLKETPGLFDNLPGNLAKIFVRLQKHYLMHEESIKKNNDALINFIDIIKQLNKFLITVSNKNKILLKDSMEERNMNKFVKIKQKDDVISESTPLKTGEKIRNTLDSSKPSVPTIQPRKTIKSTAEPFEFKTINLYGLNDNEDYSENDSDHNELGIDDSILNETDISEFFNNIEFDNDLDDDLGTESKDIHNFPFGFFLNYFDPVKGPNMFYEFAISSDPIIVDEILDTMNKNKGYYVIEVNNHIIFSYMFEIRSETSRGKVDLLQLALCINKNTFNVKNDNLSQIIRKYFIKTGQYFQSNKDIYLGLLYIRSDPKLEIPRKSILDQYVIILTILSELEMKIVELIDNKKEKENRFDFQNDTVFQNNYLKNLSEIIDLIQNMSN